MKTRVLFILLFLALINRVQAQHGKFPNVMANEDCNALLSGLYELKPEDITDFVTTDMANIKMIVSKGSIKEGSQTENLNVVLINHNDEKVLFPTPEIKASYQRQFADLFKQLQGNAAANENKMIIFTTKQGPVSSVAFFHFENQRVVGYIHPLGPKVNQGMLKFNLEEEIKFAKTNNKTLIWIGDDVGVPITETAFTGNTVLYRRPANIDKPIPMEIIPIDKKFDPATATVINAVPSTKQQLLAGGFPINKLSDWQAYKSKVQAITQDKFGKAISDVAALKEEMINGNQDVLLIVAHLRGSDLYIGDSKLSLDEIKSWGKRASGTGGKRTALLFICNAGNQKYTAGSLFWKKNITPLANVLLDNHFFDVVLAPDHTILQPETESTLKKLMEGRSLLEIQQIYKGWLPYVFIYKFQRNSNGKYS